MKKDNTIKIKKVKAEFGSSLSERIFRDSLQSIADVVNQIIKILSGKDADIKIDWQFKIETDTPGISKIVDFRFEYKNLITFIEFDSIKQHTLVRAREKDSAVDRTIKKYKLRLIRIYQDTFIKYRRRTLVLIFLLSISKNQNGVIYIRNINEIKKQEKWLKENISF